MEEVNTTSHSFVNKFLCLSEHYSSINPLGFMIPQTCGRCSSAAIRAVVWLNKLRSSWFMATSTHSHSAPHNPTLPLCPRRSCCSRTQWLCSGGCSCQKEMRDHWAFEEKKSNLAQNAIHPLEFPFIIS